MDLPASVANKRLTDGVNPLDATLTKNTGSYPSSQISPSVLVPSPRLSLPNYLPSSVHTSKFRIPQVLHLPLLRKLPGAYQQFPFRNCSRFLDVQTFTSATFPPVSDLSPFFS